MVSSEPGRPIRILELRSVRGTGGGPEKTILLGSARSDPERFPVTVCYIRDARDEIFSMSTRAQAMGVKYVEITERHSFDWRIWPQLVGLVRSESIDIVHAHDYKTDLLAFLLSWRENVIPLATVHGWIRNTWRERLYYAADTRLLTHFPAVVAVSSGIKATLIRRGLNTQCVHQIPNGVDHRMYRRNPEARARIRNELNISSTALVIGAVGRLSPEKRFDLLLEATAKVTVARPYVVIAGEGDERSLLLERAKTLGLIDRIKLVGLRSDVSDLIQAMDVFVQTSDTEGIPNAVLEAMACEVPVVATDVGGTSELIDHEIHGLLVRRGNVDSIAQAIEATVTDADAGVRRTDCARMRIERELSFDARMRRIEAVYQTLYDRERQRREGSR